MNDIQILLTHFPLMFRTFICKSSAIPNAPKFTPTLLVIHSTKCPMVIREGIACGLTIISGFIPSAVVGISASSRIIPIVPF